MTILNTYHYPCDKKSGRFSFIHKHGAVSPPPDRLPQQAEGSFNSIQINKTGKSGTSSFPAKSVKNLVKIDKIIVKSIN
jgi:hypothetical protein